MARRLVYGAFVCLCLGAVSEMVLANHAPQAPPLTPPEDSELTPDLGLGWRLPPGVSSAFGVPAPTHINAQGTRNPDLTPKPAGTRRLLTIGDSTVYGVLVDDADVFGAVAATQLSEHLGTTVEPVNGGVPGYSSAQSLRLYERVLHEVNADWVVIANLWSDTQDSRIPDTHFYLDQDRILTRLLQHSATFRWMRRTLGDRRAAREVGWRIGPGQGSYRVPPHEYRSNLGRLAEEVRSDGGAPIFLWLPSTRDLEGRELEAPRPTYRRIMAEVADAQGALLVDGATPFAGGPASLLLDDVHPSVMGHALLGQILATDIASTAP